jgi:hypothetical protein
MTAKGLHDQADGDPRGKVVSLVSSERRKLRASHNVQSSQFDEGAGGNPPTHDGDARSDRQSAANARNPSRRHGAGRWTERTGVRGTKANPVEGKHLLFGFLTTEPNDVVEPIHPKAMPVILTTAEEYDRWLCAPAEDAKTLQRPLPDGVLKIVASDERSDKSA